ncbi:glycine/D-amino acid oxidase-like deaminating enzyme [Ureibacillus xyleni]|uniref:Glycine/D-amino acid oxidase-like deaminating enzyme n=1 Tax=Ureibacillus xyleni TaxID=614648 RepID=A0A285S719_9BACL|nr:FAD-binding oxidoreductase [Ureibacillus xyleni]SOC02988.1 glycine/D-amino acid oxidase-like deaminating enzyme [Ureibacillus xyleni]
MKQKVIVIGAGIIGTSVAYYLSQKDVNVVLIDANDIAAGTSGACDKAIMLQSKKSGPNLQFAMKSAEMYKDLEEELEQDLEYENGGGMILINNEVELNVLRERVENQREAGLNVTIICGDEARKINPQLSPKIIAATWCEQDAEINPLKTSFAFAKAASNRSMTMHLNCRVLNLIEDNGRVIGVKTTNGDIYADNVVLCCGVWVNNLLKSLQLEVPIIPRKGVILVTEKIPKLLNCNILGGSYIVSKLQEASVEKNPFGIGLSMGQTKSGNLLIGGSREFASFDTSISSFVLTAVANKATEAFPCLKNTNLIRSFVGFRPFTPDNLPILGEVPTVRGLYIAAGHEGDGVALAPITGHIIAEVVTGQTVDMDLTPFHMNRFLQSFTY